MQLKLDVLPDPDWLVLIKEQRAKGKSVSQIAREIDLARSSVSMLIAGSYPAESLDLVGRKHGAKIVRTYQAGQACPHLRRTISFADCATNASAPMSTASPESLKLWRACRHCPFNPVKGATPC